MSGSVHTEQCMMYMNDANTVKSMFVRYILLARKYWPYREVTVYQSSLPGKIVSHTVVVLNGGWTSGRGRHRIKYNLI